MEPNKIRQYRKELGMTQKELYQKLKQNGYTDISLKKLQHYENANIESIPHKDMLAICSILNIQPVSLFTTGCDSEINVKDTLIHTSQALEIVSDMLVKMYPIDSKFKLTKFIESIKYYLGDIKTPTKAEKILLDAAQNTNLDIDTNTPENVFNNMLKDKFTVSIEDNYSDKSFYTDTVIQDPQQIAFVRFLAKVSGITFMELKRNGLNDIQALSLVKAILPNIPYLGYDDQE